MRKRREKREENTTTAPRSSTVGMLNIKMFFTINQWLKNVPFARTENFFTDFLSRNQSCLAKVSLIMRSIVDF